MSRLKLITSKRLKQHRGNQGIAAVWGSEKAGGETGVITEDLPKPDEVNDTETPERK